jgi:hypothetical protein
MTVPSTAVSLGAIQTEFGGAVPISLSEYYKGGGTGYVPVTEPTSPIDGAPIASSGAIRIGEFRGLSKVSLAASIAANASGNGGALSEGTLVQVTTSPATIVTVTGGSGSYSYVWNFVSGSNASIIGTAPSYQFRRGMSTPSVAVGSTSLSGVFNVTVTDTVSGGSVTSNNITVTTTCSNLT